MRFVERETLRVTLLLASACAGVRCDTSERCETTTGVCVPASGGAGGVIGRDAAVDVLDVGPTHAGKDVCRSLAGMVLIPAGEFDMGSTAAANEQPVHRVRLSAFCVDRTEVTVAAYRSCPTTACTEPRSIGACNWGRSDREDHPINCVDRSQAQGFCRWRGSDLPTEAQWEYAARGTDGRPYAWGEDAPSSRACWSGVAMRQGTCPAGAVEGDVSPFGVRDLGGNLTEWVRDLYGPYSDDTFMDPDGPAIGADFVTRGGAWDDDVESRLRSTRRGGNNPILQAYVFGFRCAAAPR
ncbi:MAG: SUMF1/EgtB/PvdO family nonheme iron enzyme [Polyangiales bacterium]